ncbi:MAG TPA: DUF4097 family beta strand repeat-containing protein [Terriglobia bacterium]|nr:DUF4097 family beta strand repeat-containing protein [Terriglobia bacterium]
MSSRRISGSIFWGVVFLALGALILANNLGYNVHVWSLLVRFWPVLLIVWGLFKLVDYFRAESGSVNRPLFSSSDVAAIIFIILFGSLITLASNMSPDLGKMIQLGDIDIWDLTGNNFTFTEHHVVDAPADSTIQITNRFGSVDVMPDDADRITVDVNKTVRAEDSASAEKLSSGFVYSITREGSKFRIAGELDRRFRVSLTVHVPKRSIVSIENRNGSITLKGLTGNQSIVNRFGTIEAKGITGSLHIENQNGQVQVEDVSDSVSISSSFAPVIVSNVRGEVKIEGHNSSVNIDQVEKDLNVQTAFQNIDIRDPRGSVTVNNRNGEVSIRLPQKPRHDITVTSQFGDVNIELPSESSFNVDARSHFGNLYSEFTELRTTYQNSDHFMTGQVGSGGPTIRIDGRNSAVRFRKTNSNSF